MSLKSNMNQQQAHDIARWFSNKKTFDATEISATALNLFNRVGQRRFKSLVMTEIKEIQQGLSRKYAGRNFIAKGIHPVKQKLVNALYNKLVRDLVMPEIYKFVDHSVETGAFLASILVAEDVENINRPCTYDQTVAAEEHYKNLITGINTQAGALDKIVAAIGAGTLDQLNLSDSDEEDEQVEDEENEQVEDEEDRLAPRLLRRAVAEASPESFRAASPPGAPLRRAQSPVKRGRMERRALDFENEEHFDIDLLIDDDEESGVKRQKN